MKPFRVALAGLALAGFWSGQTLAETSGKPVTVVELFTSQSCYSCPLAEAFLGELSDDNDIVALEYHVDYWNRIVYGRHGRWADEFSTPEMTQRQRAYNVALRDTSSVYTPQMVIDGREEAVGSRRGEVQNLIRKVRKDAQARVPVRVSSETGDGINVSLPAMADSKADVWLVTFIRENTTQVARGENHGKTLTGHNIVRRVQHIGEWRGDAATFDLSASDLALEPGQSCAILVQTDRPGPELGASYCPDSVDPASS